MQQGFTKVYPFTTEMISGYMNIMDINNKDVLTVGSSLDQAFNAVLKGAKKVTVIDINASTGLFLEEKKDILLTSSYDEFYTKVLSSKKFEYTEELFSFNDLKKMNLYLKDEESYEELKKRLLTSEIEFRYGNIFEIDKYINNKFDVIILSNILQYLMIYKPDIDLNKFILDSFNKWDNLLNKDGIIQLIYLYSYSRGFNNTLQGYTLKDFVEALWEYQLCIYDFECNYNNHDAVILYEKKK